MQENWTTERRRLTCLIAAALLLANSGCLLVAAGAGAAAGGAGYAYYKGKHCRAYPAGTGDVWAAAQAALPELGMPVDGAVRQGDAGTITSRTAAGDPVRIDVEAQPGRAPAEETTTRVCVRVATFGDQAFSQRLLDQVGYHLVPASPAGSPGPGTPPPATLSPPSPAEVPPQTAPPPLLPPEPIPSDSSASSRRE